MNKKIIILITLTLITVVTGVTFFKKIAPIEFEKNIRVRNELPAALIGEIKSFQRPGEIISWLQVRNLKWEVLSDSKLAEKDSRPEFSEYAIRISDFTDLDTKGTLELNFINRRLYKSVFYPVDYKAYVNKLSGKYHVQMEIKKSLKIGDTVTVELGESYNGQPYIQWKDIPLENEVVEWIKRFS